MLKEVLYGDPDPSQERRPISLILQQGPAIFASLIALILVGTVALLLFGPPSIVPLWAALLMRGAGITFAACGYVVHRRLAMLSREGVRLMGTILEYRRSALSGSSAVSEIEVRINEPPFEGITFVSRITGFPTLSYPVGTTHPVLAHLTRRTFELDRPGREVIILVPLVLVSLAAFLLPEFSTYIETDRK